WGAEALEVNPDGFRRLATFRPVPLPGGDAAIRRPVRQAIARLAAAGAEISPRLLQRLRVSEREAAVWIHQTRRGLNAPTTHAAGRLFDAFSCLLGFAPDSISYDGQPAVRLETAARRATRTTSRELPFKTVVNGTRLEIDWSPAFLVLANPDTIEGCEDEWALAVHRAIVRASVAMIEYGVSHSTERCVALTGGVFMNRILNNLLVEELERLGLRVLLHRKTPPNDGCLSLGQVVIAGTAQD
ncbi:MAG: hypothetical protein N2255_01480, partial [Kiritimatiellae bacterium]|nr:hypothetical protein [Kiritimatiellia bacterium]